MTEADLINGVQRAAVSAFSGVTYEPDGIREVLVDYFRDIGYRLFAEKLEAAMQSLEQDECDCGDGEELLS